MSFTNKTIGNPASFVGFKNYIRLLGDAEYRRSILNTVFFTAVSILVKTVLGMLMALSLNQKFKGRNIARALLMIPWTLLLSYITGDRYLIQQVELPIIF